MSLTVAVELHCDFCNEWLGDHHPTRKSAWKSAKANGWRKLLDGKHCCEVCLKNGEYRKKKHWDNSSLKDGT